MQVRLASIDKNLEALSGGLIAAEKLPEVLHDVLNAKGRLSLLEMSTRAPGRLSLNPPHVEDLAVQQASESEVELNERLDQGLLPGRAKQENIGVFKHSVFVSLAGEYFDVLSYLQALERLPWKFYWEAIDYQVTDYPRAKVVIEVYTLSTEAGILGV